GILLVQHHGHAGLLGRSGHGNAHVPAEANRGSFVGKGDWLGRFETDIREAKRSILVRAPYVSEAAVKKLLPALRDARERGLEVTCAMRKRAASERSDSRDAAAAALL
ncbi:hypothetical protein, partial [Adlercreutzia sp. DFI.6.23]|uniref:hypothetical protein n=1 Tax=Adlercreutzia sp. DFI.6.23 TaxID=2963705 RepID=UPI00210EE945